MTGLGGVAWRSWPGRKFKKREQPAEMQLPQFYGRTTASSQLQQPSQPSCFFPVAAVAGRWQWRQVQAHARQGQGQVRAGEVQVQAEAQVPGGVGGREGAGAVWLTAGWR